jgi:hypothetical protein
MLYRNLNKDIGSFHFSYPPSPPQNDGSASRRGNGGAGGRREQLGVGGVAPFGYAFGRAYPPTPTGASNWG